MDTFLTRCGDSYYSYYGGIKEWSGLHLLVDHKPPSQADKLNGIEWNAMVRFQFDAERVRLDSRWQDPVDMMCFEIWKENDAWRVDTCLQSQRNLLNGIPPKDKITCEEVERLKKQLNS